MVVAAVYGHCLARQHAQQYDHIDQTMPILQLTAALAGRYRVERELGTGGMATVYLAHDLRHNRKVALKVLRDDVLMASVAGARFLREIEIAARLQHPNILPLHDSGEAVADGQTFLFFAMPYVEGQSLRQRIDRDGELPVPEALRILVEIVDALSYAHAHGVVHRDIKPDKVMISRVGDYVRRFTEAVADTLSIRVRFVAAADTRWLPTSESRRRSSPPLAGTIDPRAAARGIPRQVDSLPPALR